APRPAPAAAGNAGLRPPAPDAPEPPGPCDRNALPQHRLVAPCSDHQLAAHTHLPWLPPHPAPLPGSGAPAARSNPLAGRGTTPPVSLRRDGGVPDAGP